MERRRRETHLPLLISGAISMVPETFTSTALNASCEICPNLLYFTRDL